MFTVILCVLIQHIIGDVLALAGGAGSSVNASQNTAQWVLKCYVSMCYDLLFVHSSGIVK